ncbi:hypothetical protein BH10BDE1_BH10BDE1_29340 [soil metagenome]
MAGLQPNSPLFRKRALLLLRLVAVYVSVSVIGHLLEDLFQVSGLMPADGNGDPPIAGIILVSLVTFLWTLTSTAVQLTVTARLLFPQTMAKGLSPLRAVELISVETLRAISATMIRLPLLLIPGIFEWIRLTPIPFIVLLDPAYQKGDRDALEAARRFFKKYGVLVLSFLILSMALFLAEFSLTPTPSDSLAIWQAPLQHIGSILIFSALRFALDAATLAGYASKFPKLTMPAQAGSNIA